MSAPPKGTPPAKAKHLVDGLRPPPLPQLPHHYASYLKAYEQYMLASVHFARIEQRLTRRDGSGPTIAWAAFGQGLIVPSDQTWTKIDGSWLSSQPPVAPVPSAKTAPKAAKPEVPKATVPPKQSKGKGKATASSASTASSAAPSRPASPAPSSTAPVTRVEITSGNWKFADPSTVVTAVDDYLMSSNDIEGMAETLVSMIAGSPVLANPGPLRQQLGIPRTVSSAASFASVASSGTSTPTPKGPESTQAPSEKKAPRKKRLTPAQKVKRDALRSQRAEKLKEDLALLKTQNAILAASKRQEKLRVATKALGPGKGTSLAAVLAAEKQDKHIKRVRKSPSYRRRLEKRRVQRGLVPPTPGPSQP